MAITANCESFFFKILDCFIGKADKGNAQVVWLSLRNANAKVDMVAQMVKANQLPPNMKTEFDNLTARFKTLSKTRNFYCHSAYIPHEHDENKLDHIEYYSFARHDDPDWVYQTKTKPAAVSTVNELLQAIRQADILSDEMLTFLHKIRSHTGAQHVDLPQLLN